ncbi:MAG: N-acetylmuramoyl-L-alanine amidase [Bacteroidota bacterium]|nr:N-acetylmuramoyl-L-alanine amidase [Bacteroidota bacterium]
MRILLIILFSGFLVFNLKAQSFYIFRDTVSLSSNSGEAIFTDRQFNGLTIQSERLLDWNSIEIIVGSNLSKPDTIKLSQDEHIEGFQSNLLTFNHQTNFLIRSKQAITLELIFQYVEPIQTNLSLPNLKRALCDAPSGIIQQIVWRQGLNAPKVGRTSTKTHHCIVHHSAGGNSQTDYTQLVRSYYIQHTEVNGWDDIGYNYLIAADGSIFAGRDPEKPEISQDNVLGAHFCSKNANTMGVCLIGDYEISNPSTAIMASLKELLLWKYVKDTLSPLSTAIHPQSGGSALEALAGHRQGCATICPGNGVFNLLADLRNDLYGEYIKCLPFVSINSYEINDKQIVYPNPSQNKVHLHSEYLNQIEKLYLYNTLGTIISQNISEVYDLPSGFYIFVIELIDGRKFKQKIIVLE